MTDYILQIDFKDQSIYEKNKGFIKDIIKRKHKLSNFDMAGQRWYSSSIHDVEVKRIVGSDNIHTTGLKVAGDKSLADSLVSFLSSMSGVVITWITAPVSNTIDFDVKEIVDFEVASFSAYIYRRVDHGEVSKEIADLYIRRWAEVVEYYEYNKRGKYEL